MTSESAKLINLPKLIIDYFNGHNGNSTMNVDLEALKHSVDVKWYEMSPVTQSANGITRKVELKYAGHQQEIYSVLGLVQNVKKVQRVSLGGVMVTGLPQPIRLPLSALPSKVREIFGDELIIRDKVTWETKSEHEAPELNSKSQINGRAKGGRRVAMVTTTESTCEYYFECTVELENTVLIQLTQNGEDQHYRADIARIVHGMKSKFPVELEQLHASTRADITRPRSLPSSVVTWTLTGECEFKWSSQPDVKWT
ncbi:unnamed protein product [Lymnaea stagnalis]|uniref:Uncharacterized protein n=1 Tax=Lymnaea stagnalis TaxID=6523 RepID=A0AAV2HPI2_LYMST